MNRVTRVFLSLVILVGIVSPARADEETAVVLHAGRILDVGSGEYQSDVLIKIENGRIREIVDVDEVHASTEWIDLSDYTVLPGLMDVHTHLCDNTYMGDAFDHWALPAASFGIAGVVNARKLLESGFTTVRNVSEPYYAGVALRDAIASGWIEGPRMLVSGQMITMTGGHGDWGGWMAAEHNVQTPAEAVADGVDEVRKAVREHIQNGVDLIKVAATGGFHTSGSIPGAATYSIQELRAAVEEAAKRGFHVAAHAHGEEGILNAVAAGVRSIEHGSFLGEESIRQMKENGVFLVMDLLAAHYDLIEANEDFRDKELKSGNEDFYREYSSRFTRAYNAGVRMAFGTDSGIYPHGRNAEQFALMIEAGMTPIDAIRSATLWAAELLGIEENAGRVRAGMWADLVAVKGDPLVDGSTLTDIRFVMKAGKIVKKVPGTKTAP